MDVRRRITHDNHDETKGAYLESIKKIDTFEKLPKECVKYTSGGGGASLITFAFVVALVMAELSRFVNPDVSFRYSVDNALEGELPINIDMTVAMRCSEVSMDVLDINGNLVASSSQVKVINSRFELSPRRKRRFELKRKQMSLLRQQHHSVHQYFWMSRTTSNEFNLHSFHYSREYEVPESQADACRFVGTFKVRKSPGNLHIATGKAFGQNTNVHIHIAPLYFNGPRNFSHRIHHLSFGRPLGNHIHPLDAEEVISNDSTLMYQYFIEVVPTTLTNRLEILDTYQYAVTEQARSVNRNQSQGVPGVFFRYDVFPVRVEVNATGEMSVARLLVRLAAIIGGVFATGNLLCFLISTLSYSLSTQMLFRRTSRPGLSPSSPLVPESES
uniref:Endoplasmic reticulum-Golgi intermediate compartment protein 2 n=1 Tax=Mesocestoides corti TaxID=53468 RepID=A0A5K3ENT6_MESCO